VIGLALLLSVASIADRPIDPDPIDGRPIARLAGPIVPDATLARMRGGVLLPNGITLTLGIDIQTRVDGTLVLHSIYNSDGPDAGIRVFTDGKDSPRAAPGTITVLAISCGVAPSG